MILKRSAKFLSTYDHRQVLLIFFFPFSLLCQECFIFVTSVKNLTQDIYSGFKRNEALTKRKISSEFQHNQFFCNRLQTLIFLSSNHLKKKKSKFMVTSTHNHLRH